MNISYLMNNSIIPNIILSTSLSATTNNNSHAGSVIVADRRSVAILGEMAGRTDPAITFNNPK
jgi:hypothetical protein